jgi:uncharacterized protein involved in exopolysaccharide biosynthesis
MVEIPETDTTATEESFGLPWRDILGSTFRHRKMILGLTAAGALAMVILGFLSPPAYQAKATLMMVAKRADAKVSPDEREVTQVERIDDTVVNSEANWLSSDGVMRKVLEPWRAKVEGGRPSSGLNSVINAITLPVRFPSIVYQRFHGTPAPSPFDDWVDSVEKRLTVNPVKQSSVIELTYQDSSPQFAAQLLNSLIAERMARQKSFTQQEEAVDFYNEQSKLLAEHVRDAETALQNFYEQEGIVGGPDERKALRDRLTEIRGMLARARTDLSEARVRSAFLEKSMAQVPQHIQGSRNPTGSIQTRVLELMLERSKLLSRYAPTSVKIVDIDEQIAQAKRMLQEESKMIAEGQSAMNPTFLDLEKELIQTRTQSAALEARISALTQEEQGYIEQMRKSVDGSATLEQLETDLERAKDAHRTYIQKSEEARFSSALDTSQILNMTVAVPPAVPTAPLTTRNGIMSLLGALAGLTIGIGLAYVRDLIDPTVKSAAEVGRLMGIPVLGEVST